jgi:hypothetical protein
MSNFKTRSLIGAHLHAGFAEGLAAAALRLAIDGDPTFHANAHAAQRPARSMEHRPSKARLARLRNGGGDNRTVRHDDASAVHLQLDVLSHDAKLRLRSATANRVRPELVAFGSITNLPAIVLCRVKL